MYRFRYINKLVQFGQTNYTLILEDLEGGLPTQRIEKCFQCDVNLLDDTFLTNEAYKEINRVIAEQAALTIDDSGD